jgi:uncharacterized protein YndB with AHSA1/START domain
VQLERTFEADVDRVFRAFTDPVQLARWRGPMNVPTSRQEGTTIPTRNTARVVRQVVVDSAAFMAFTAG